VGPPVSESQPNRRSSVVEKTDKCSDGRLGQTGREEVDHGWARKIREEAGPKPILGLKSNRVKENEF
jgi:hypothetical protein